MTENETMMEPKDKATKKPTKRSKTQKKEGGGCTCKDKNGCKSGRCGCSVNARICDESCACASHKKCFNSLGNSALEVGNQSSEQSCASNNNDQDKENNGDTIPCTPPKKKRWAFFIHQHDTAIVGIFLTISLLFRSQQWRWHHQSIRLLTQKTKPYFHHKRRHVTSRLDDCMKLSFKFIKLMDILLLLLLLSVNRFHELSFVLAHKILNCFILNYFWHF